MKSHKHVVFWWREHFSQSKFKDDIESVNTIDVLSAFPKIEWENAMEPNFNLKCDAFSTPFTCELEYRKHVFLTGRWHFSYANQIQKEKHSGNRTGAVLNDFTDLES